MSVITRIEARFAELSKKQAVIARYITDNLHDAAFMNSSQICRHLGVSEATLTRFVYKIGYSSFAEFHQEVCRNFQAHNPSNPFRQEHYEPAENTIYNKIFRLEKGLLDETLDLINPSLFDEVVSLLHSSAEVLLIGGPTHAFLAEYMHHFLTIFRERVRVVNNLNLSLLGTAEDIDQDSVALIFSYPRYPNETQTIAQLLKDRKVPLIGITDSLLSPLVPLMDYTLVTPQRYLLIVDPLASAMAMIHSLLLGVYTKDPEGIKERVSHYEKAVLATNMFVYKDYDFAEKL